MTARNLIWISLAITLPLWAQGNNSNSQGNNSNSQGNNSDSQGNNSNSQSNQKSNAHHEAQIEPNAGTWRTWVISSGKDYRVPPPPGHSETRAELKSLADLISHNDAQTRQQIQFWDAGAPAYRWMDIVSTRL